MTEPETSTSSRSTRDLTTAGIAVVVALLAGGLAGYALHGSKTKTVTQTNTVTVTSVVTNDVTKNVMPASCIAAMNEEVTAVQVLGDLVLKLQKDGETAAINGGTGAQQVVGFIAALRQQTDDMNAAFAKLPKDIKEQRAACQTAISS